MCSDKGLMDPLQQLLNRFGSYAVAESSWKTHSWLLNSVVLRGFTTLVTRSLDTLKHPFYTFIEEMKMSHPDGSPYHVEGSVMAFLYIQNSPQGTFEQKCCFPGCYTSRQWWRFPHPRGYFHALSRRRTGGFVLILSAGSTSKQV